MNSSEARSSGPEGGSRLRQMRVATLFAVGILALVLLANPAAAEGNDTTGPTLADGQRGNATTILVTVADDTDVDEGSIDAADFSLSDGHVRSVRANQSGSNESGSNATVSLLLDGKLNADEVTVSVDGDATITDETGNSITPGSVTVTGMDSILPQLREYRVERVNDTTARIVVRAGEPLSGLQFEIHGPIDANLTRDDFRAVDDNRYGVPHVTTYRFPTDGVYRLRVASLVDDAGHLVNYSRDRTFVRDAEGPTAVLRGPTHLETGDLGRFNGSASRDNVGIASYEWTVDGDDAGNGSGFEHAFDEPGTHRVRLTVADERGNDATTNWSVTVHDAVSKRGVTVTTTNDTGRRAVVGTNRTNERVRIADDYGTLVGDDGVTVHSLTVTLPTNETLRLNVSGNATTPSFADETGRTALTAVSIAHGNESVEEPTFRFAVSASRLSRAGISFADVALYRHDGTWTTLPTDIVRATKSTVVYEATAPGLSTFVVGAAGAENGWQASAGGSDDPGATGGNGADVRVTGATLVTESVAFGEYAVVEATLTNEGEGRGTYVAGLTVGPDVVEARPVTVAAGETRTISFATKAVRSGTVAVNGTVAGELNVTGGTATAESPTATSVATNGSDGGGGFDVPIPDPLALWPDGLVGAILTGVVGVTVATYSVLKALAIYLGY